MQPSMCLMRLKQQSVGQTLEQLLPLLLPKFLQYRSNFANYTARPNVSWMNMPIRPTEIIASTFCKDCTAPDPAQIIRTLVKRDSRVLQLRSSDILPGSAFVGRPQADEIDEDAVGPGAENVGRIPVPEGISPRMQNLYLLELDLNHRLGTFLNPRPNEEAA